MEGALPSVVAGLVSVPVIAVPTSIGYGASFGGIAALLGMLNSCASGVSVVNIDNGFGAANIASLINHSVGAPAVSVRRDSCRAKIEALEPVRRFRASIPVVRARPLHYESAVRHLTPCSQESFGLSNSIASSRPSAASR